MVGEPVEPLPGAGRRRDDALLESGGNRQSVTRLQRAGRLKHRRVVGGLGSGRVLGRGTDRPRIGREPADPGARRQVDLDLRLENGEIPVVAGGVPVELVMIGEEPRHASQRVVNHIAVRAGIDHGVGVADADALAIVDALGGIRLGLSIAIDRQDFQGRIVFRAVGVAQHGEDVAEDAVPDAVALRGDADRLGDVDRAVGREHGLAIETVDRLGGERRQGQRQNRQRSDNQRLEAADDARPAWTDRMQHGLSPPTPWLAP